MSPTISVVTACRNAVSCIDRAICSVEAQGVAGVEYIVIDGASTDGTAEIIKKHASSIAYWVSEPDQGLTDALIKGFSRATGDILCWLNADDHFEAGAFKQVLFAVERAPDAVAWVGAARRRSKGGRPKRVATPALEGFPGQGVWWKEVRIPQAACFFSAAAYRKVGGLDSRFNLTMDLDLWLRLAKVGRFEAIPQVLANVTIDDGTLSGRDPALTMSEAISAYCVNGHHQLAARLFEHYARHEYWKQTLYRSGPVKALRGWLEPE